MYVYKAVNNINDTLFYYREWTASRANEEKEDMHGIAYPEGKGVRSLLYLHNKRWKRIRIYIWKKAIYVFVQTIKSSLKSQK